jgi:hypothetical protein
MEWYIGITPTDAAHQRDLLSRIRSIVTTYQVDGLLLDFIRWPLHWEIEFRPGQPRPLDSSFDTRTIELFEEATGLQLPADLTTVAQRAAWIRNLHAQEWIDYKCRVITDFVREARKTVKGARADAALGVFTVPDIDGQTEALTGQRIRDLAPLADFIAPMLYHNILLRPPGWVGEAVSKVVKMAGARKTLPVVQADSNRDTTVPGDWGPPMSLENWKATLAEVRGNFDSLAGILIFPGTSLVGNGRGELMRNMLAA